MKKRDLRIYILLITFLCYLSIVFALNFNGLTYTLDGKTLNGTIINITIRSSDFSVIGYNSSTSNETGGFNFTVSENQAWMYQVSLYHKNGSFVDYVGKSLPALPYGEFSTIAPMSFYLDTAGTINLTVINSTGQRITFEYEIKDTKLGFPIAEEFDNYVSEAVVNVPLNRNYSAVIFPQQNMPANFNWNNFSAITSYTFGTALTGILSNYNYTTKTVNKQFNITNQLLRLTGYINKTGIVGWNTNSITIVPYVLEPGNTVFAGEPMPYNFSMPNAHGDFYNVTNGFYNISLPAAAEVSNMILFATAANSSIYYGAFRNLSLSLGDASQQLNFSMQGLFGNPLNISMNNLNGWNLVNISTSLQTFNLVNSTNSTLSQASAFAELTVDYSGYDAIEFKLAVDVDQNSASSGIIIPLLNVTGVKEMNVYSNNYAPKRLTKTVAEINLNNNVTMTTFNPGEIDGTVGQSSVSIALYISNSTCDVPSPPTACNLGNSATMDSFNPIRSVFGGGAISFRMGIGNVKIHYVNVDMIASGPPDALFDDSTTNAGSSSSFDQALRFGSGGPTIYDYVLVSIPYSETAGSGLNENGEVNMSIPVLYDDNWNIAWNTTTNGTSSTSLAGNYSHYSNKATDWSTLMSLTTCVTSVSNFNATYPCYIDTANNQIWIRLPHFSGTGPNVKGSVAASSSSTTTSSSGSSGGSNQTALTFKPTGEQLSLGYTQILKVNEQIEVTISGEKHNVRLAEVGSSYVKIIVQSNPQNATLFVGDTKKFELDNNGNYDLSVTLKSLGNNKAEMIVRKIFELIKEVPKDTTGSVPKGEGVSQINTNNQENLNPEEEKSGSNIKLLLFIFALIVFMFISGYYFLNRRNKPPHEKRKWL